MDRAKFFLNTLGFYSHAEIPSDSYLNNVSTFLLWEFNPGQKNCWKEMLTNTSVRKVEGDTFAAHLSDWIILHPIIYRDEEGYGDPEFIPEDHFKISRQQFWDLLLSWESIWQMPIRPLEIVITHDAEKIKIEPRFYRSALLSNKDPFLASQYPDIKTLGAFFNSLRLIRHNFFKDFLINSDQKELTQQSIKLKKEGSSITITSNASNTEPFTLSIQQLDHLIDQWVALMNQPQKPSSVIIAQEGDSIIFVPSYEQKEPGNNNAS